MGNESRVVLATGSDNVGARTQSKTVLRIAAACAPETWRGQALGVFKSDLDRLAPGRFDVQLYFNDAAFAKGTEIDAMRRGDIEGALTQPEDIAAFIPEYSIFDTPYVMRDPAHLDAVFDGEIGGEYRTRVSEKIGVHIERSQFYEYSHVILREAGDVRSPEDLAGVRLRMPTPPAWVFLGQAMGAVAVPLPYTDILEALRTGAVDGLEFPLADAITAGFVDLSKRIVLTSHIVSNVFFTLANGFWNGLSQEERTLINSAQARAKTFNDESAITAEADTIAALRDRGLDVTTPDVARFRDHVQQAFRASPFAAKWPPGLLERVNAAGR